MTVEKLITDHIDLWTGAVTQKSGSGRGSSSKLELTGIKALRKLILELAVRGKLVRQDSRDDSADVFLDELDRGKRVKSSGECPVSAAQLPSGWATAPLTQFGSFAGGKTPSKAKAQYWAGAIPWVSPKDMSSDQIESAQDHVTDAALEDGLALHPAGSILIVVRSGILRRKLPVAITKIPCTVNQDLKVLRLHDGSYGLYLRLMLLGFESFILRELTKTGVTVESVKFREFSAQPFPIPPVAEQHRIVQKVDELMALCDQLEQQTGDQIEAHERLVDTLLDTLTRATNATELAENWARVQQHFDTLFTTEHSIDRLKQTILQLAVMGRLVPQDPADGVASELIEKLREHGATLEQVGETKRAIKPKLITREEWPFALPIGWAWCEFQSLMDPRFSISYGVLVPGPEDPDGVPLVRVADLTMEEHVALPEKKIAAKVDQKFAKTRLVGGEILLCVVGSVGKLGIAPESWIGANIARAICRLMPSPLISKEFLILVLQTTFMQERFGVDTRTLAQPTLNIGMIRAAPTPLPPLAEQRRIVERVNDLMKLCEELRIAVRQGNDIRCILADALVERAVN